jgi:DNA-binding IclR family transcriptional regulator
MHAAGEKPTHIAKRLGVARSSVYRMLEDTPDLGGSLTAVGD